LLKVAHVIYSFGIGGLEKGITTLINYGSPDVEHIIISLCGNRDSERFLNRSVNIISLEKPGRNSLRFICTLAGIIRDLQPDVVHTRNWSGMDGILAARLAGIKTIIHGEHGWDMFDPLGTNLKRRLIRRLTAPLVSRYTCVSRPLEHWLKYEVKVGKPVTQIYNGIDTTQFKSVDQVQKKRIKIQLGFQPEEFLIGIVARLDAIKNHSTLFQAFSMVGKAHPEARFLVIGDGPEMNRLKTEAPENVHFMGYRSDTCFLMKSLDLFVLPSFNEGMSNTILEAMATGLPVIASDVGGNPELVENGVSGFLVDPRNPGRMAEKIMDYIQNPEKAMDHGKRGHHLAVDKFSIDAMVQKYEAVYNAI